MWYTVKVLDNRKRVSVQRSLFLMNEQEYKEEAKTLGKCS